MGVRWGENGVGRGARNGGRVGGGGGGGDRNGVGWK